VYGAAHARGFIEVHHAVSITEVDGLVNPDADLLPLCSNCHSMAHRTDGRILTLKELRELLEGGRQRRAGEA
jgi:predicted HNH restriction endonuclease